MAGVAITNNNAHFLKGPVHVFVDVAVPAEGAVMTLDTDTGSGWKTPETVQNPNALYVGCLNDVKPTGEVTVAEDYCDNMSSPILVLPERTKYGLEFDIIALMNAALMAKVYGTVNTTVSSKDLISFGSVENFPTMAVALIGRMVSDPTKYWYTLLFSCRQTRVWAANEFKMNKLSRGKLVFVPQSLSGRAVGKDIGHHYINI